MGESWPTGQFLDGSERNPINRLRGSQIMTILNNVFRTPTERAKCLVQENSLPSHEIAKMTDLNVLQVLAMKVKAGTYKPA